MQTTESTARRCPKCNNFGEQISQILAGNGNKLKTMKCTTVLCLWHDTTWAYELQDDGKVPEHDYTTKLYPTRDQMPKRPPEEILKQRMDRLKDDA